MQRQHLAYLALVVASFLFGATFVVVKDAVAELAPIGFVGWRFLLGAAVLFAIGVPRTAAVWRQGAIAGLFLFGGYALQTQGLVSTSASNSGLITGLYVVLTPLVAAGVARRTPRPLVIAGALLAVVGFGILTIQNGLNLAEGDLLTVGAALSFAGHIVYLAKTAHRHDVLRYTAVQLLVTAILGLAWSAITEGFPLPGRESLGAILLTGLAVSAGAFLLQVWSQTVIGPSRTAIILALEPAFAAASGAVLLDERLGTRGWIGAALIIVAIYIVLGATGDEDELPAAEAITAAH
jgi:drug/metabolite transporter (DMT)-like permease